VRECVVVAGEGELVGLVGAERIWEKERKD
jgi:hypothetical protein